MLAKLQNMSEVWQKRLFVVMTAAAIAPLYFESASQIGGTLFLLSLILLSIVAWSKKNISLNAFEKGWIWVAMIYTLVFVLSFLLRPPYTCDGIWRLSSSGFILLLLVWFWISIKLKLGTTVIKSVAFMSLIFAILLLGLELYISKGWYVGYRYGGVLADLGKTGFFLPLTAFLLGLLFLKERRAVYLVLYFVAFLLSALVASRTALAMITVPLFFTVVYFLFSTKSLSCVKKLGVVIIALAVIGSSMYLSKSKLDETFHDYKLAEHSNYYSSMGMRLAMLKVGMQMVENHYVLGVGPNLYKTELKHYVRLTNYSEEVKNSISSFTHLHNQFLMDFVLSGIAGIISLILFIGYPIKVLYQLFKYGRKEEAIFGIGFMVGFWFILFFGAIFTYTYTTILYMLTIGSVILFYRDELGKKHD
ncbi:O-antigen ligase family protein [Hydrogenovibrio marinus]|uniref:O-antigen ligase-related domain-containing protein n=1 Tax=Hydrogenovibrio marinus TaxID=28885 RepID=A0A067A201_HYDMR|nr:O-antigen ligase family protein [Hydrogenovibrio marinus]KDN96631.1 hypothetical protein EI16_10285 [Hydrogenovibrio marinus]BBN60158.1 hypothetical protein HVMH_1752 [Hydrogenovibrio marinus]